MQNDKAETGASGLTDAELFSPVETDTADAEHIAAPRYSYWKSVFRVFFRKRLNIVILVLLALLIVFAYVYPLFSGYDKYQNVLVENGKHLSPSAATVIISTGSSARAGSVNRPLTLSGAARAFR